MSEETRTIAQLDAAAPLNGDNYLAVYQPKVENLLTGKPGDTRKATLDEVAEYVNEPLEGKIAAEAEERERGDAALERAIAEFGQIPAAGLPVNRGGTGATTALEALKNLGAVSPPPANPYAHWPCDDLPDMPDDPEGIRYRNDPQWSGWGESGTGTININDGIITTVGNNHLTNAIRANPGDVIIVRARMTSGTLSNLQSDTFSSATGSGYGPTIVYGLLSRKWQTFCLILQDGQYGIKNIHRAVYASISGTLEISDLYVGNCSYLAHLIDNSGNGRHINLSGKAVATRGRFGRGLRFLGLDAIITHADIMNLYKQPSSLSMWVNVEAWGSGGYAFIAGWYQYNHGCIKLSSNNITISWQKSGGDATATETINFSKDFALNTWYLITLAFDLTTAKLYIDGALAVTKTDTAPPVDCLYHMLGGGNDTNNTTLRLFKGSLDEIALFDRALTDAEIWALYNAPLPKQVIGHTAAEDITDITIDAAQGVKIGRNHALPNAQIKNVIIGNNVTLDSIEGSTPDVTNCVIIGNDISGVGGMGQVQKSVVIGSNNVGNFNNAGNCLFNQNVVIGDDVAKHVTGANQVRIGAADADIYGHFQNTSDRRDKADIRDTVLGLEFIEKLRPVDYKWDYRSQYAEFEDQETGELKTITPDGSKKRKRFHHGFIAQDIQEVIQETGIDFGGYQDHTVNGGMESMSLGYTEFIGPLVKAVQELSARVKELEEKDE